MSNPQQPLQENGAEDLEQPSMKSRKDPSQFPGRLFLVLVPSLLLLAWLVLALTGRDLDSQTKIFDVALKIVAISATILGAIWSYYGFFRERLKEARLNVTHEIESLDLPDGKRLLKVYAMIANIGQVRVELLFWHLRAEQILPLTTKAQEDLKKLAFTDRYGHAHWKCLAKGYFRHDDRSFKVTLEPGEMDRVAANLVIDGGIDAVQVYSHFSRTEHAKRAGGWQGRTLVDLRQTDKGGTS